MEIEPNTDVCGHFSAESRGLCRRGGVPCWYSSASHRSLVERLTRPLRRQDLVINPVCVDERGGRPRTARDRTRPDNRSSVVVRPACLRSSPSYRDVETDGRTNGRTQAVRLPVPAAVYQRQPVSHACAMSGLASWLAIHALEGVMF